MTLELENVGIIKEASVKIDGLTVIAGENDTGKSTVAKALYLMLDACQLDAKFSTIASDEYKKDVFVVAIKQLMGKIFKYNKLKINSYIKLTTNQRTYSIDNNDKFEGELTSDENDIIFVETPLIWNFKKFFTDLALIESQMNIDIDYPYLMKALNFKLSIKSKQNGIDIKNRLLSLMKGEFKQDKRSGDFFFQKDDYGLEVINIATGIQYFGIFQVLSQNNWLNKDSVLILDEPDNHLHPKWQLEMAKIIVELVKNGVKVLVNSHSPYMIEALKRYSEVEKIEDKTNFYLAENGKIEQIESNNEKTLSKIFAKLSEPFDEFDKMDSEILNG